MSQQNRTTLKTYFETGDKPTESQFSNLVDSCFNLVDDIINNSDTLFVSPNGNDSTAVKGNSLRPYLTINAAKTAALAGNLIYVHPGIYNEKNLLKDLVNYYFSPGAKVISDDIAAGAIFDDSPTGTNSAVTCLITGYGEFTRGNYDEWYAIFYIENSSDIFIQCVSMDGLNVTPMQIFGGTIKANVSHFIKSTEGDGIDASNCDLYIKSNIIESTTDGYSLRIGNNTTASFFGNKLISNKRCIDVGGANSIVNCYFNEMISNGTDIVASVVGLLLIYNCIIKNIFVGANPNAIISARSGGTLQLYNCSITGHSNKAVLSNEAATGKTTLYLCRLENFADNVNAHTIVQALGGTLILNNVVLVCTNATANSVYSIAAQDILVYNGVANNSLHVNITEKVSNLIIDPLVI